MITILQLLRELTKREDIAESSVDIMEAPAAGALTGDELAIVVKDGVAVRTTAQAIADLGGGGADPTIFRTYGPYHVDYTDILHDGDRITLFTPDAEDVGALVIAQWWAANEGFVPFTTGNVVIGQSPSGPFGHTDSWGYIATPSLATDSVTESINGHHWIAGQGDIATMAVHIINQEPIQVAYLGGGMAPDQEAGSMDIFFLMGEVAGLYT